jgi:hypothetical protein
VALKYLLCSERTATSLAGTLNRTPSKTLNPEPSKTLNPEPSKTLNPEPSKTQNPEKALKIRNTRITPLKKTRRMQRNIAHIGQSTLIASDWL